MSDQSESADASSRRKFLLASGAVGVAGLAGCSSQADTGDAGDDSGSDPLLADPEGFDPTAPNWTENNYLMTPLIEAGYERGGQADLERMSSRDVEEVPHGSPVQQTPDDSTELIDPDTLVFTESPSEDVQGRYEEDFQAVFDRIEEETGKSVEYNKVNSYAASVEAMRSERAHIANFSTGTTCFAVNLCGAVPFAAGVAPDGAFGYRLFAITRDSADQIQSVEDFTNDDVTIAHAEPASNSGHQAPSALFDQKFDVTAGEDYEINFSGGHSQTSRGIAAGDYDAGPVCSTCIKDTVDADSNLEYGDFKVVWASNPFPNGPIAYRYNLKPEIIEGIKRAWLDSNFEGTAYAQRTGYNEYVPITYRKHWYDIMVIQRYNNVEYTDSALSA